MKNKLFFFIQAILRYVPFQIGIWARNMLYPYFFQSYGKNVRIFDSVVIKFPNDISIGNDVTINQFCYIVGKGGLKLGNDVMVGSGCKITTSSHDFDSIATPMRTQGISFLPIILENDIWLGFNVIILGGAIVREGCILAAGSLILKNEFDAYSIVGGVPGKIIRSRR